MIALRVGWNPDLACSPLEDLILISFVSLVRLDRVVLDLMLGAAIDASWLMLFYIYSDKHV